MQGRGQFWLKWSAIEMEVDIYSDLGSTTQMARLCRHFRRALEQVQDILDQNRLLIKLSSCGLCGCLVEKLNSIEKEEKVLKNKL